MTSSTTRLAWRRLLAGALVAVSGLALAGCTTKDQDLPTLGGTKGPVAGTSLEDIAKKYYDCMSADQIPMEIIENSKGEKVVVQIEFGGHDILQSNGKDGGGLVGYADDRMPSEADMQAQSDFFDQAGDEPALRLDGVDRSETFARCLKESGYNEQEAWGPYQADPEAMQLQVTANNQWAACAREHGWPDVKDSVMPTKMDGSEWPTVFLPNTMTEDQVRQLVTACPTFDADQTTRIKDWLHANPTSTSMPDDYMPDPSIQFDMPAAFNGPGSEGEYDPNWTPSPEDQATMEHIDKLYDILNKAANDFYETYQADNKDGGMAVSSEGPAEGQ